LDGSGFALWAFQEMKRSSWAIKSLENSVYFSGDPGYDTHYKTIGNRPGPFDVVFMDSGHYDKRWRAIHNMPDEVIKGFNDLGGAICYQRSGLCLTCHCITGSTLPLN